MNRTDLTKMSAEEALGKLIFILNPYTKGVPGTATIGPGSPGDDIDLSQISIEIDDYEGHWSFKGNDHRVKRAVRIQYRYNGEAGDLGVLTTEHLLIGFLGSGGGE
jgi:hypothetical protein